MRAFEAMVPKPTDTRCYGAEIIPIVDDVERGPNAAWKVLVSKREIRQTREEASTDIVAVEEYWWTGGYPSRTKRMTNNIDFTDGGLHRAVQARKRNYRAYFCRRVLPIKISWSGFFDVRAR